MHARSGTIDERGRGLRRHRTASPADAASSREFSPRLFLAYLDVDALPGSLDRLPGWSARRRALVHFRRRDFFDGRPAPLGDAVRDLVEERLGRRPDGPVHLLAHLRTFGWLFNPLAVYYCWSADGRVLDAVVLEVTNTPWGERHWYVIDARTDTGAATSCQGHARVALPARWTSTIEVSWTAPGDTLHLDIAVVREGETMFTAGLALRRRVLDRRQALGILLRHPAHAAARVARDLSPGRGAVPRATCPCTVIPSRPAQEIAA